MNKKQIILISFACICSFISAALLTYFLLKLDNPYDSSQITVLIFLIYNFMCNIVIIILIINLVNIHYSTIIVNSIIELVHISLLIYITIISQLTIAELLCNIICISVSYVLIIIYFIIKIESKDEKMIK
jgi:hypothetical protein